jgi:hypothetical protein
MVENKSLELRTLELPERRMIDRQLLKTARADGEKLEFTFMRQWG